jgi:MerR family transcriptional regulator, light-induced transcriptional regulator
VLAKERIFQTVRKLALTMNDLLSPKQVAQALKVSESSVKRWCDKGSITTIYTDGGHRRIRLADLAGFVRSRSLSIQDFTPVGLDADAICSGDIEIARDSLLQALLDGNEDRSQQIILELYLAKHSVSQICDEVIARAFHEIGQRWACGQAEIYQERLGCRIAHRFLTRLLLMVAEPASDAPLAIGCSTVGDIYSLGSMMVELVLRDSGWRASALGENLPLTSLAAAARVHRPQLIWVSCSHLEDPKQFIEDYTALVSELSPEVGFVVGGRALDSNLLSQMKFDAHCGSMLELQQFAKQFGEKLRQKNRCSLTPTSDGSDNDRNLV